MKLHETTLRGIIRNEVDKVLNEELSISNDVKYIADEITDKICTGEFNFTIDLYNFGEWEIVALPMERGRMICKTDSLNKILTVGFALKNGNVDRIGLREKVFHEVEHIFQLSKMNDTENGTRKRYTALYNKAVKTFMNQASSVEERELARYIYCCSTLEQDAFVNELYGELTNEKVISNEQETDVYLNSSALKALVTIQDVRRDILEKGKGKPYQDAAALYGKPIKWFIYLGNVAERRLMEKIRKVFFKAREDRQAHTDFPTINLDVVAY